MQPNTDICRTDCPSGFLSVDKVCTQLDQLSICFDFRDKNIQIESAGIDYEIDQGEGPSPFPVYQRGMFLPQSTTLTLPGLVLNTKFTLEFILRPEIAGSFLKVSDMTQTSFIELLLSEFDLDFAFKDQLNFREGSWDLNTWHNMAVTVNLLEVRLYIDGVPLGLLHALPEVIIDSLDNSHRIGNDFQGLIYTFCIHQFINTELYTDYPVNCNALSTISCEECDTTCLEGCIRPTDCRQCLDLLCGDCDTFEGLCALDGCIENAVNEEGVCFCEPPNYYQVDIDAC